MSNIYIQEPPSHGKVLLETTAGDIDIELWSREAPKACRNFIQLCMEGYYNGTIFHRLVPTFIVQGGDPTGTGTGGKSVWGKPFKDEFHSRLRFVRRGLVAMANAGKDDNSSQFFFTLGPTPELQNKHTLFGKVTGNTIYNMLKLEEGETEDERPLYPHKIVSTKILMNPFDDIIPRETIKKSSSDKRRNKDKRDSGTKNYKLLSFGEEAEEEEEEVAVINKKYSGKSKSSHDLTNDPKLSSQLAVEPSSRHRDKKRKHLGDDNDDGTLTSSKDSEEKDKEDQIEKDARLLSVQEKLKSKSKSFSESKKSKPTEEIINNSSKSKNLSTKSSHKDDEEEEDEPYYLGKDEELANKKKLEDLKKEYRELKGSIRKAEKEKVVAATKVGDNSSTEGSTSTNSNNNLIEEFVQRQKEYKAKTAPSKVKGADREAATMLLLAKFSKKLESAKESKPTTEVSSAKSEQQNDDDPDDETWLTKTLHEDEVEAPTLARDASLKTDDWKDIHDPKNPMVQRRRHEAKRKAASTHYKRDLI